MRTGLKNLVVFIFILFFSGQDMKAQLCPWQVQNSWLIYSFHLECEGSSFTITFNPQYFESFLWYNGSTSNTMTMTTTGWHWVDITKDGCTGRDSIFVLFSTPPILELGNDTTICEGDTLRLVSGNWEPYTSYFWNTGSIAPYLDVTKAGTYRARVYNGCTVEDTIKVMIRPKPVIDFGPDKFLCPGGTVFLNTGIVDLSSTQLTWQDNSHFGIYEVTQPGLYYVTASNECGAFSDSVVFSPVTPPVSQLGPDTAVCKNDNLILTAGGNSMMDEYLWSNNSTDPFLTVNKGGTYWVKISRGGCEVTDTILVNSIQKPAFTLGPNKVICDNNTVELKPDKYFSNLLWQDGSTDPVFIARQPGTYFLQASNVCGSSTDTVLLKPGICKLYIPTAFTPNKDGKNDVFRIPPELGMTLKELTVYNRWGQKVFTTNDINKGWDGTLNGQLAPAGAYVYHIKGRLIDEDITTSGTITLVR